MTKKNPVKKAAKKKKQETDITETLLAKVEELQIRDLRWTEKQLQLINLIQDKKTKIIFISGVAGTGKTLLSVYCGLKAIQEKKTDSMIYIRSVVESASKSLGFLPGTAEEKSSPFAVPLLEKMDELLPIQQVDGLMESGAVRAISNHFLRGTQMRCTVLVDESQGFEKFELKTIITRFAEGAKFIFCGDFEQSDIGKKSGFRDYFDTFNNEESRANGIHCFEFGKEDIMRAKILKFVCEKIEGMK